MITEQFSFSPFLSNTHTYSLFVPVCKFSLHYCEIIVIQYMTPLCLLLYMMEPFQSFIKWVLLYKLHLTLLLKNSVWFLPNTISFFPCLRPPSDHVRPILFTKLYLIPHTHMYVWERVQIHGYNTLSEHKVHYTDDLSLNERIYWIQIEYPLPLATLLKFVSPVLS